MFIVALAVYTFTLCPTVAGGDSGELVVAACTLGIPHPPGYPLHTILAHILFRILPTGTPAARINYLSAFCSAATSALIYMTGEILASWNLNDDEDILVETNPSSPSSFRRTDCSSTANPNGPSHGAKASVDPVGSEATGAFHPPWASLLLAHDEPPRPITTSTTAEPPTDLEPPSLSIQPSHLAGPPGALPASDTPMPPPVTVPGNRSAAQQELRQELRLASRCGAALAAGLYSFSPLVWTYSVHAEVTPSPTPARHAASLSRTPARRRV
jgi:hypothetical protein